MDLQNFIDQNKVNYLELFKKENLYVRKYSKNGLALIKAKRDKEYNYEEHPWMRYCRGAIIDINMDRVVCVPPLKAYYEPDLIKILNEINEGDKKVFQPLIEGTMVNMFYHNDEWIISTRSNIGAKNSWDGKIPFHHMFKEIMGTEWFEELDKECCYSFVLRHKKNRIVVPVEENAIYLVECYRINGDGIHPEILPEIDGIVSNFDMNEYGLESYNDYLPYTIKGFTMKQGNFRLNWINPTYLYVKRLKMNNNHTFLNYIELRQKRLLVEYLNYFPEDQYQFNEYKVNYNKIKDQLYEEYVSIFIRKTKKMKDTNYSLKPLLYELHEYYKTTKNKINMKIVSDYMHQLPSKKMLFIYNYFY